MSTSRGVGQDHEEDNDNTKGNNQTDHSNSEDLYKADHITKDMHGSLEGGNNDANEESQEEMHGNVVTPLSGTVTEMGENNHDTTGNVDTKRDTTKGSEDQIN